MFAWSWIPATVAASIFQVGRNALQRGVMTSAGPWGATLVRFLFGLPFSLLLVAILLLVMPGAHPHFGGAFWVSAVVGAASQVLATASLLMAMHRSGFAVGTALQQSSLPLAALVGLFVYHDRLSATAWFSYLVPEPFDVAKDWYAREGVVPINHMFVVHQDLTKTNPEAVREIHRMLVESRKLTEGGVPAVYPPIGMEANRKGIQLAIDWALDQKIIPHRLSVDELFDDVTATLGT